MTTEIIIVAIAIATSGGWLFACHRGMVKEPWSHHSLAIAGGIITLGILPIIKSVLRTRSETKAQFAPLVVEVRRPTDKEVEATDKEVADAIEEIEDVKIQLAEIDTAEALARSGDDSSATGTIAVDRLRRLRERRD